MKLIMKKFVFVALMLLTMSITACADNFKAPAKNKESVEYTDTTTAHTYEIKDIKYPIFKSKSGAYYIWKTSKRTNKKYKYYLPKAIQKQLGRVYNDEK